MVVGLYFKFVFGSQDGHIMKLGLTLRFLFEIGFLSFKSVQSLQMSRRHQN